MDVDALLNTEAASGRVALAAKVALSNCSLGAECPIYFEALARALEEEPPPFDTAVYADIYNSASVSGQWMAVSLITNAEREGDGAQRLWSLAACSDDAEVQRQLKYHAVDESRHALFYLSLVDLTFPGRVDPAFRQELNKLSPHYSLRQELHAVEGSPYAKKPTIDDFLQMNIAEIRTAIHHIMQRPAVSRHCSADHQARITSIQDVLLRDELKHVSYTAVLIEGIAQNYTMDQVTSLFCRRFRDFNQITLEELGDKAFDCSVSCCAKRPWCRAKAPGSELSSLRVLPN
jgi:hypothetical protein